MPPRPRPWVRGQPSTIPQPPPPAPVTRTIDLGPAQVPVDLPASLEEALVRLAEAEDTLRAIGAGEVDAFVVADGMSGRKVFTLSTADRPYRMFVENMRDGAATLSSSGLIMFANRRLAEMLACPKEWIVGSPLSSFVSDSTPVHLDAIRGPGGRGATLEFDLRDAEGVALPCWSARRRSRSTARS